VEDLEEDAKPEDLMLSYVSGDKSKVSDSSKRSSSRGRLSGGSSRGVRAAAAAAEGVLGQ
jgi:hypothetical protein